jgi:hypothetical protein
MRDDNDPMWEFLRERAESRREASASPGLSDVRFRRESVVRILDAAVGVLAATRRFVEVAEDVVKEQRDRLAIAPVVEGDERPYAGTDGQPATKIDLTY